MDLFDYKQKENIKTNAPLARRMRPRTLEEFFGQKHIVGEGTLLEKLIKKDNISSVIFYGPPGTGKTALAHIIASSTKSFFEQVNAVTSGVKEIRKVINLGKERLVTEQKDTILFIDEIHRFNKSQQDALLPAVEDGIVVLIGATTENPYYEVNPPLISRSRVFELEPLSEDNIKKILDNALKDSERGFGDYCIEIEKEALEHLARSPGGDARSALNALEVAVLTALKGENEILEIKLEDVEEALQKPVINYDQSGDNHYDTISAFIKSMRGSDPDAAVYWLAKMIYAGEDPAFIARRLIVHAAEDVGNADPKALEIAAAAAEAVRFVGLPEARIPLTQAAVYIACAPKSNACVKAIDQALEDVEKGSAGRVPEHLRNTDPNYLYPHNYPHNLVKQKYFPEDMEPRIYYTPGDTGYEKKLKKRLKAWKEYLDAQEKQ